MVLFSDIHEAFNGFGQEEVVRIKEYHIIAFGRFYSQVAGRTYAAVFFLNQTEAMVYEEWLDEVDTVIR